MPPKLRVILLCSSSHVGSAIIFNQLAGSPDIEIVGVVKSPAFKGGKDSARKYLKKLGWKFSWLLVWQRLAQALAYGLSVPLSFFTGKKLPLPGWYLIWRGGIPHFYYNQLDPAAVGDFIRARAPDLIISAYFNRILKPEIIGLPRLGVLNVHPGWLPSYKGVMSYFWALRNNEDRAGVTLHWINEGIDTGDIIFKRAFTVRPETTQHQVLLKSAVIGARMALMAVRRLRRGERLPATAQAHDAGGAYYSMPDEAAFEDYFRRRRFFRLRDVFSALWSAVARVIFRKK